MLVVTCVTRHVSRVSHVMLVVTGVVKLFKSHHSVLSVTFD